MSVQLRARARFGKRETFVSLRVRRYIVAISGLALLQMLTGCILTSERPAVPLDVPDGYRAGHGTSAPPALDWWRSFRSSELTGLIEEAQTNNNDIGAAIARIVQADAQAKITSAPLFPSLEADVTGTRSKAAGGTPKGDIRAVLSASYQLDFWGKNRYASLSAQETAVATRFAKEVVVISTVVSVGNAYLLVLSSQDRLRLARQNVAASTRVLDLIKQRFEAGTASQLDIAQQESLVAQVRATVPVFDQTLAPEHRDARGTDRPSADRPQGQGRQPL